jgi:hypothetical protein
VLAADLEDLAGLLGDLDQRLALGDGQRHRLFEVDVLARRQRVDGHRLVPVVRGRDEDRVNRRAGQQRTVVREHGRRAAGARPGAVDASRGRRDRNRLD